MNSEIIDPDTDGNFISKDVLTNPGLHNELLLLSLHRAHKERAKAEKQTSDFSDRLTVKVQFQDNWRVHKSLSETSQGAVAMCYYCS